MYQEVSTLIYIKLNFDQYIQYYFLVEEYRLTSRALVQSQKIYEKGRMMQTLVISILADRDGFFLDKALNSIY